MRTTHSTNSTGNGGGRTGANVADCAVAAVAAVEAVENGESALGDTEVAGRPCRAPEDVRALDDLGPQWVCDLVRVHLRRRAHA